MSNRLLILILIFYCGCQTKTDTPKMFSEVPASLSTVTFRNDIAEDENYNILTYEYLYNGGGVAVGDLNNDGLPDLVFTANMLPNKVYLNKGNFRFEDVTAKAGLQGRARWKTGVVMADVNGDGLLDVYVCYSGPGPDSARSDELYINTGIRDGLPSFKESAKEYGLDAPGTFTTTVAFFDMDNDGDLDMFMVNHADMFFNPFFNTDRLRSERNPKFGNRLYRNDEGHFTDVSEQAHIYGGGLNFGLSVSVSDINNDGWADIYVTNDYDDRDYLYLNNRDGTFREVMDKAAGHISQFAMGSDIADFNNDGRTDIMVLDMLPEDNHRQKLLRGADPFDQYTMRIDHGFHHQQMRNTLQLNDGQDSSGMPMFSEIGQMAGISATDWSWAPLFADFDNDGWKDLFISNGILRDMTNLDFVKYTSGYSQNHSDSLQDKTEMWKLVQQMPSTLKTNYLYRNNHDLRFDNVTSSWGLDKAAINNGAAYADLDNDGKLDLVINTLNGAPVIYRNNGNATKKTHYLRLRLAGSRKNSFALGAKVSLQTASGYQFQEQFTSRGFQSSVDPVMHFGLGQDSLIYSLKVVWPGGKSSLFENVMADTLLVISDSGAVNERIHPKEMLHPLFAAASADNGIVLTDQSSPDVDFKTSPLLPYQLSKAGPCLAGADVNGDGLEDLFVGVSSGKGSVLFLQGSDGKFTAARDQPWNAEAEIAATDALFFDADGDGDEDLYLVAGGANFYINSKNYQDRLYQNDGHGKFTKAELALPPETSSGSCVRAADINHDGRPDLYVGGYTQLGLFPAPSPGFILRNVSAKGNLRFEKDTAPHDTALFHVGMVTDAVWVDLNHDGWEDLCVVGRFMPLKIFENHNGTLQDRTDAYGLKGTEGWWCRVLADDFDHDGDTDLVVGNIGSNSPMRASPAQPCDIVYGDFNDDGVSDPLLCWYNGGKEYPYFSRDELLSQIPSLQKKFSRYSDYADAEISDVLSQEQLAASNRVSLKYTASVYLQNDGGKFSIKLLPGYAQLSAINGMVSKDVDGDGNADIVLAGNFFPFRAQMGPMDASMGMVLKGNGKGGFRPLLFPETGLCIRGDIRSFLSISTSGRSYFVAAVNNGPLQVIQSTHPDKIKQ